MLTDESIPRAREIADDDGRHAVEIVRERAAEWGVKPDRIGMVGFSAGAFLATDLAMDPRGTPLAFIAPIYGGETQGRPVPNVVVLRLHKPTYPPEAIKASHNA